MEISIILEKKDWKLFQANLEKELPKTIKSKTNSFWFNLILWAVLALVFLSIFHNISQIHWPTAGFVSVFFILFNGLFFFNLSKIRKAFEPSQNGVFIGKHNFVFNEEGIKSKCQGYEGYHSWSIVKKIDRVNNMILIYLDTAYAYIFPENQLDDPDQFYQYINEQFKNYNR